MTTKLDPYNYEFMRLGSDAMRITNIYIHLNREFGLIDVADISSEITSSDGNIYVEGRRFKCRGLEMSIRPDNNILLDIAVEYK